MEPKPAITFYQLKEFVNKLTEEQLQYPVVAMGEERGFDIQSAEELGEDMYIDDEGMNPMNTFEPADEDDKIEDYPVILASRPYLYFDL